jgi:carboxyl-terminal processing protease
MRQLTTMGLVSIFCALSQAGGQQASSTATQGGTSPAAASASTPSIEFKEVFEVVRTNLPGITEEELYRAAARGLIAQLRPKVTLADEQSANTALTNLSTLRALTVDKFYAYVRVGQVASGADSKFADTLASLNKTNRFKGIVLDLRFSGGEDYAAAGAIADRFFSGEQPLLDYGNGLKKSTSKTDAINVPVAILVNAKTVGASEALAGILRHNEIGLLIGANTGGQANIAKNVTLSTGQALRIATIPVKTGNGNPLPVSGLKPDIVVDVSPDEELDYVEEVYKDRPSFTQTPVVTNETASAASTNRPRRRINEAELVRMLRDGLNPEAEMAAPRRTPIPTTVQDPALARAIDLLKGLSVVQQTRTVGSEPRN